MTWQRYDDSGTRWTWDGDEERHVLALVGNEMREYHEVPNGAPVVHVYAADLDAIADGFGPLDGAEHVTTYTVAVRFAPWVRALDDFELFDWLETAKYVTATEGR